MTKDLLYALKWFCRLEKEQWLSIDELKKLQWIRLKNILDHAYHHTAFYKKRFDYAGIRPKDIQYPDDIKKIPIITREDLRQPDQLIAKSCKKSDLFSSQTSGSSGRRTTTFFDRNAWIMAKYLIKIRARLACGLRPWDRIAMFTELEAKNTLLKERILRQKSFSILDSIENQVETLEQYKPSAAYGFPSYFSLLADLKAKFHPSIIFTSSELLDEWTRCKIESQFQSDVFDVYGCTEVKEISWECPEHKGYHINSDWLFVEFLNNWKMDLEESSSIVVTSLYNYGMPLIRYEIGDTGKYLNKQCPCGRGLPLMAPTLGRQVDYFMLPDRSMISPYKITCAIENMEGMKQYQIVQMKIDHVLLKVIPTKGFNEEQKRKLKHALEKILPGVTVKVKVVKEIEKEKSRKYKIILSYVER